LIKVVYFDRVCRTTGDIIKVSEWYRTHTDSVDDAALVFGIVGLCYHPLSGGTFRCWEIGFTISQQNDDLRNIGTFVQVKLIGGGVNSVTNVGVTSLLFLGVGNSISDCRRTG